MVGPDQNVRAEGSVAGFSALHLASESELQKLTEILASLASEVAAHGGVSAVYAGVTGYGGMQARSSQLLQTVLARYLNLSGDAVTLSSDIELACLAAFEPGAGYLVYAGTGSIAGFVDEGRQFHRAGGRGGILDDGGSGYWITLEALRQIWRAEDDAPACWVDSPMAVVLFKEIGGSDWSLTRKLIYGASRGQIGQLALAIASTADVDPTANNILQRAGVELARLGNVMVSRFGMRPIALGGRVPELHRSIEQSMREHLAPGADLRPVHLQAHITAARMALGPTQ